MELEAKWKDFGRKCGHARARSQHVRAPTRNAGYRMKTLLAGVLLALPVAATATEVTDNFESGTNPNQWGWQNNDGGHAIIELAGGNPGAWLDSGANYFSDHPNLTTVPPPGSPLRAALDSGTLHSA